MNNDNLAGPFNVYPAIGEHQQHQQQQQHHQPQPMIAMDQNVLGLLNQTLQGLANRLQNPPAAGGNGGGGAGGGHGVQRFDTKIPPYYARPGEDFSNFERQARLIARMNGWSVLNTATATLAALRGTATSMTQNMTVEEGQYATVDDFFNELRKLFVTPAYKEIAQATFHSRAQKTDENIRQFHSKLAVLWWDAYGEEEEPWRLDPNAALPEGRPNARQDIKGFKSWRLINQFTRGIRDRTLRSAMKLMVKSNGPISDYTAALTMAMGIQADRQQLEVEDRHVKQCDNAPTFDEIDQPLVKTQNKAKKYKDGEEPMEIGALSAPPRQQQGQRPMRAYSNQAGTQGPRGQAGPGKQYCLRHGYCNHTTKTCREYNSRLATARNLASRNQAQQQPRRQMRILTGSGQQEKQKEERLCYHCNRPGHFARECPQKLRHIVADEDDDYVEDHEAFEHDEPSMGDEEEYAYMDACSHNEGADTSPPAFLGYNDGFVGN